MGGFLQLTMVGKIALMESPLAQAHSPEKVNFPLPPNSKSDTLSFS